MPLIWLEPAETTASIAEPTRFMSSTRIVTWFEA